MNTAATPSKFELFVRANNFALILSMLLMFTQAMHTSHALYDLTALPSEWQKITFSVLTALFMDFLIIYFVASGAIRESYIFFAFCACMNIYAYHIDHAFLSDFRSYFSLIPAIGVPYAVHAVAMQMRRERSDQYDSSLVINDKEDRRAPKSNSSLVQRNISKNELTFSGDQVEW